MSIYDQARALGKEMLECEAAPVSYTHLDVYKRQLQTFVCFSKMMLNSLNSSDKRRVYIKWICQ